MTLSNNIQEILNTTDRFAAGAGCRVTEVDATHAVAEMTVAKGHLNAGGVCQGGALFTLADLAMAALINHQGNLTFGISSNVMFVSSAVEGDRLRAEAVPVADHHKLPAIEVRVTNQEGRLICHLTGMGYRKEAEFPGVKS
ncbi:MAG: PaaI family thioesterase [Bacteroidales bacterium]|nr:PaaI family thioesterase [Bacteroidales bacterium]